VVEPQAEAPAAGTKAEDDDGTPVLKSVAEALAAGIEEEDGGGTPAAPNAAIVGCSHFINVQ
jgi:hypothetical protein